MANQMIALGARAPQVNPIGNAIAQNAQMINLMRQQDVAERQAATAAQTAQIARAQEARAAAQEGREIQKFALDRDALIYAKHRGVAPAVAQGGPEVYRQWLADYRADNPKVASLLEQAMPVDKFNADKFILMMGTMDQRFEARYGKAITKEMIGPNGEMFAANISGIPGASYAVPLPDISKPNKGAPAAPVTGGGAAPAGGFTPTRGANTTPADLKAQMPAVTPDRLEAAARAAARGARATDPIFDGLTEDQFRQMQVRADEIRAGGNASLKPASFSGAGQPDLGGIVQQMMQTGVVSASDLQALRAAAGPQKEAQLAQLLRESNVRIMPDEQPVEGMQSAVYRPDQGDASMIEAQYNPNDYEQVRVKSPMQGPLPGSSQVPLGRVRAEAQAGRETPEEAAAKTRATKRAEIEVEREKAAPAKQQVSKIISKIRDAYTNLNNAEAIPSSKRGAAANIWDYLSVSAPGREIQRAFGTETSKSLTDITASRKLLATAIKNATGMSAQEMNSNVELQLMLDALTDPTQGYESALSVLGTLEDLYGAPKKTTAARPGAKKVVRTGTANGRRVVQYSDGTIDYAD